MAYHTGDRQPVHSSALGPTPVTGSSDGSSNRESSRSTELGDSVAVVREWGIVCMFGADEKTNVFQRAAGILSNMLLTRPC